MKKLLAALLACLMVFAVVACTPKPVKTDDESAGESSPAGGELAGTYDFVIWAADNVVELTKQQIEKFNNTNTDGIKINATVEPVSEADAATNMINDVEKGADLFCFAQDQFARLLQAGALAKLGAGAVAFVKENNAAGVVSAAASGEEYYAYPLTADNGYFMYYDKSVIPEADVDDLEKLIADCEAAQKYFAFEMNSSAWYLASFFFGAGCHSVWKTDDDGKYISIDDDFNSDKGLIAVKGMKKLVDSDFHLSSSKGSEFASGAAIVVTGTWDYETISGILGDNMGVTDLPSFTVDGTSYHLGSFNGCKLMGVKPQSDAVKGAVAHKLAQYLTGYDCQMERFEQKAWGPSNIQAQASEAVQANPGLAALLKQSPYSVPQGQIEGSWWDTAKVIADDVKAATDEAGLKAALQNYEDKIKAVFTMTDEVKNAFTVIGNINGDGWTVDLEMVKDDNGVWKTKDAYEMTDTTEFKVRKGRSWDEAYPGENFKVETAGTYYVQFDENTHEVTLVAA